MNPRSWRISFFFGTVIAIVVAIVLRMRPHAHSVYESDAPAAPEPAPTAARVSAATPIPRARTTTPPTAHSEPQPADDEAIATTRARDVLGSDPDRALALLDDADRAHPDGGLAEARAALRVDALVAARRIGPARDAAEIYLARYPQGREAQRIEMLTGVHPRPADTPD